MQANHPLFVSTFTDDRRSFARLPRGKFPGAGFVAALRTSRERLP